VRLGRNARQTLRFFSSPEAGDSCGRIGCIAGSLSRAIALLCDGEITSHTVNVLYVANARLAPPALGSIRLFWPFALGAAARRVLRAFGPFARSFPLISQLRHARSHIGWNSGFGCAAFFLVIRFAAMRARPGWLSSFWGRFMASRYSGYCAAAGD